MTATVLEFGDRVLCYTDGLTEEHVYWDRSSVTPGCGS